MKTRVTKKPVTQKELLLRTKYPNLFLGVAGYDKNHPMPRMKIDGHFEEFSWLKNFLSPRISQIYISRIVPILLEYRPIRINHLFKEDEHEFIRILDERGNDLIIPDYFACPGDTTIGQKIDLLPGELGEEISFMLSQFSYTDAAIIYKSPAGISVPKWIEKQIADEKAKIHAEVEEIDKEYKSMNQKLVSIVTKQHSGFTEFEYCDSEKPTPPAGITHRDSEKPKSRRLRKGEQIKRSKDLFDRRNLDDWFL